MAKTLDSIPNLLPLYAKAAAGSTKKRPNSIEIKVDALAVKSVTVGRDRDEEFRALAGAPKAEHAFFGHVHALIMPIQMELMAADDFPLPMMGLVHTENTYRELSPVVLGGKVDIEVRVAAFRAHRSGTEVILASTVTASESGATLVEEESVYLAKGVRLKDAEGFDEVQAQREAIKSGAQTIKREQFKVPFPTAQWRLAGNTGRRWAKVSGDWNPIHITAGSAKALGMPGAIAHGMYTASRALAESDRLPGEPFEFHIAFGAPVVLPSTINVALTRTGLPAGAAHDLTATGAATAGRAIDIVAWDRKKKRPHFTGSVRPLR
ncbi:MaoC/PaaZ C-terminal domain-containing protein [Corynebacterium lactis]|uniref:Dehydratase n=1 Tax=Corynebacterium lactis RW2-5 TaxID=1408189 RepID=A0A0K2H1V6_9CORY|nr:MaoC/PaaZ C-terminal domain-containing protein [Corynebacterium lactis]ALA68014.1 dehydratase [Corynebacterium lactis RW2-5]